jgi:hypothetical protein
MEANQKPHSLNIPLVKLNNLIVRSVLKEIAKSLALIGLQILTWSSPDWLPHHLINIQRETKFS